MIYEIYFSNGAAGITGLSPTFSMFKKSSDGSDVTPPAITEIGGGAYKFTYVPSETIVFEIDGTNTLDDANRYIPGKLTTNDASLDAAVSSRSTVTLAGIWDRLTSALTTSGSIGKLIVDFLDVAVSSRADSSAFSSAVSTGVIQSLVTILDNSPQQIVRGDTKTLEITAGTGWSFTGKKVFFIAKANPTADNSTAIVNREATVTSATTAEITLTITESGTVGSYHGEFEQRDNDGTSNPLTVRQFPLAIIQDVRQ